MARLEVEDNCFENPLQLLGIFVSLMYHFLAGCFFLFLYSSGAVQPSVSKQYSKYCVMFPVACFARVWWCY